MIIIIRGHFLHRFLHRRKIITRAKLQSFGSRAPDRLLLFSPPPPPNLKRPSRPRLSQLVPCPQFLSCLLLSFFIFFIFFEIRWGPLIWRREEGERGGGDPGILRK